MEKQGIRALRTSPAPHGSPDGPDGGPRSTFVGIWGAPGKVLDILLSQKSVSCNPSHARNASFELNDEADVLADQQTTAFAVLKQVKCAGASRRRAPGGVFEAVWIQKLTSQDPSRSRSASLGLNNDACVLSDQQATAT